MCNCLVGNKHVMSNYIYVLFKNLYFSYYLGTNTILLIKYHWSHRYFFKPRKKVISDLEVTWLVGKDLVMRLKPTLYCESWSRILFCSVFFKRLCLETVFPVLCPVIYCPALWIFSLEVYLCLVCPEGRDDTELSSVSVTMYYYLGNVKANAI